MSDKHTPPTWRNLQIFLLVTRSWMIIVSQIRETHQCLWGVSATSRYGLGSRTDVSYIVVLFGSAPLPTFCRHGQWGELWLVTELCSALWMVTDLCSAIWLVTALCSVLWLVDYEPCPISAYKRAIQHQATLPRSVISFDTIFGGQLGDWNSLVLNISWALVKFGVTTNWPNSYYPF